MHRGLVGIGEWAFDLQGDVVMIIGNIGTTPVLFIGLIMMVSEIYVLIDKEQ